MDGVDAAKPSKRQAGSAEVSLRAALRKAELAENLNKTHKPAWTTFLNMCLSEGLKPTKAAYQQAWTALSLPIHQVNTDGQSALNCACSGNHRDVCEWLYGEWPQPASRVEWMSWVRSACLGGNLSAFEWLMKCVGVVAKEGGGGGGDLAREGAGGDLAKEVDAWLREAESFFALRECLEGSMDRPPPRLPPNVISSRSVVGCRAGLARAHISFHPPSLL
jgi:hypothetical protein